MQRKQTFNYFSNNKNNPEEKRKTALKKSWKITKIFLYLIAFTVTLTGCIQSFVLKTSANVGNSIEFYRNEADIAPKVSTFKLENISNTINKYDNKGQALSDSKIELSIDVLKQDADANVLVDSREIIKKLSTQTKENKGEYGKSGQFMTAISVVGVEDSKLSNLGYQANVAGKKYNIVEKNGRFLFRSEDAKSYKYTNELTGPENEIVILTYLPDSSKDFIQLKKDKEETKDANGKVTTKTWNNVDADSKYTATFISGLQKVDFVTEEKLNTISDDSVDSKSLANRAYARDILQTFYNYTFGKDSKFLNELNKTTQEEYGKNDFQSVGQYLQFLVNKIENKENKLKDNQDLFKLSQKEYGLIGIYQNLMITWLTELGIAPKRSNSKGAVEISNELMFASNKYDVNANTIEEFIVKYNDNTNNAKFYSDIVFAGDYQIQPILTWGQAWTYGPFYGALVYPLSVMVQSLRQAMPEWNGWATIIAILVAVIFTRLLVLAFSFKATMMQSIQEGLKSKKAAIEAKYAGFENNKAMKMKKNQEIQALYSKYNINPLDQFANLLLSMPIFFAMWRVIQGIPEIKQTFWLGINFSSVSWQKITSGHFIYLWILITTIVVQLVSQLLPQLLNRKKNNMTMTISEKQALKKSERTQKIMMIIFTGITILFSAGVQVYWLFGGLWQIGQVLAIHRIKKTKWFKFKYSKKMMKK